MDTFSTVMEALGKLLLAATLAGAIGLERERKGRAAGLRTHVLVCLGATLTMVVSDLLAREWVAMNAPVWLDKGRIAAGVITGIGFLGAGTIINVGRSQRGLTTAAMIWFVAALGIAIGVGLYWIATAATGLALVLVIGLEYIEDRVMPTERIILSLELFHVLENREAIEAAIRKAGFRVHPYRVRVRQLESDVAELGYEIESRGHGKIPPLVDTLLREFTDIRQIECSR